jgi:L,D-peptidoglycan transpeptidase YkuD (ErfK/YbiS/YcfS/YnhG family)
VVHAADLQATVERPATHRFARAVRMIALRPISGPSGAVVHLAVVRADGSRTPLGRMQLRDGWIRRYVFQAAVTIPAGTRIEMSVTRTDNELWMSLTGDPAAEDSGARIAFEFVN